MNTDNTNSKSIAEIAAECEVSAMTVSRALRSNTSVKESTRKKIMEVAERLGYCHSIKPGRPPSETPRAQARPTIDLVLGTTKRSTEIFYAELLRSIEQTLTAKGFDCIVRTCGLDYEQFIELRDRLRLSPSQGSIITGEFKAEELKALIDVAHRAVLVDNPGDFSLKTPYNCISFDNEEAAKMAVKHLVECGRKRILLLTGPAEHYFSKAMASGYTMALSEAGLAFSAELIVRTDFTALNAGDELEKAIGHGLNFDAIFTNDEMALGVYRILAKRNIRIPEDVAVCGCDGLMIGTQLSPALTTISLDYIEMGRIAVENILSEHYAKKPCRLKLLPDLCVRESTAMAK